MSTAENTAPGYAPALVDQLTAKGWIRAKLAGYQGHPGYIKFLANGHYSLIQLGATGRFTLAKIVGGMEESAKQVDLTEVLACK